MTASPTQVIMQDALRFVATYLQQPTCIEVAMTIEAHGEAEKPKPAAAKAFSAARQNPQ